MGQESKGALKRIINNDQASLAYEFLSYRITGADLQSLLLYVYENRVRGVTVNDVKSQYERNRFVQPCEFDQRDFSLLERTIYDIVPIDFQAVELSPVNPLGINALLTEVNQKNILSTIRNVEVIADVTTALTLECVRRRTLNPNEKVDVCTNQRTTRLQKYEDGSGFSPHFKVFAMCSAGKDIGHDSFEKESLIAHIGVYLEILEKSRELGYSTANLTVTLSDIKISEKIIEQLILERDDMGRKIREGTLGRDIKSSFPSRIQNLNLLSVNEISEMEINAEVERLEKIGKEVFGDLISMYPDVNFLYEMDRIGGIGYYQDICFKVEATNLNGEVFQLVDGGFTDWTQVLLSNRKERLLTGGIGTEFMMRKFGKLL